MRRAGMEQLLSKCVFYRRCNCSTTPKKTDDEMYTYTFDGWDNDFGYAVNDIIYYPVY